MTSPHWSFLKPGSHPGSHPVFDWRRGQYECSSQNCIIEVTFSIDYTSQMVDKDAVILNVVPTTLDKNVKELMNGDHSQQPAPDSQLWIFYSKESPLMNYGQRKYVARLPVHGIWSYYSDSQIRMPYG